jgi:hypothetical protein
MIMTHTFSDTFSATEKAGRLIRMFGWVNLVLTVALIAAVGISIVAESEFVPAWDWIVFVPAIVLSVVYLLVGAGIKGYKTWAKIAGAALAVFSLLIFPIGTLIGIFVLVYLVRGWKEPPPGLAANPA